MTQAGHWKADVEFNQVVDQLGKAIARKCLRKALRPATQPTLDAERRIAGQHVRTGSLRKSLALKISIKKGVGAGIAGPRSDYVISKGKRVKKVKGKDGKARIPKAGKDDKYIRPSFYAHFLTGGSKRQKAFGMLTKSLAIGGPKFSVILRSELGKAIEDELKKIVHGKTK